MKKRVAGLLLALCLVSPVVPFADECMEGNCDNGFGTGFTDDNKVYEGEWKGGMPHGKGKLYVSKGEVIEGTWENGVLVEERKEEEKKESGDK